MISELVVDMNKPGEALVLGKDGQWRRLGITYPEFLRQEQEAKSAPCPAGQPMQIGNTGGGLNAGSLPAPRFLSPIVTQTVDPSAGTTAAANCEAGTGGNRGSLGTLWVACSDRAAGAAWVDRMKRVATEMHANKKSDTEIIAVMEKMKDEFYLTHPNSAKAYGKQSVAAGLGKATPDKEAKLATPIPTRQPGVAAPANSPIVTHVTRQLEPAGRTTLPRWKTPGTQPPNTSVVSPGNNRPPPVQANPSFVSVSGTGGGPSASTSAPLKVQGAFAPARQVTSGRSGRR